MKNLCSTSGQTLASLLVFMAVSAIIMTSTGKMITWSSKATRGIASNIDLNEISNTFHLLTQNPANCINSGLASVDATTLLAPSPLPVELSLGKTGHAMLTAGTVYGGTRKVLSVSLSRLLANANPNSYLGTILVKTELIGNALTMRNPTLSFNLNITLDAAKNLISCYGAGGVDPDLAATNPSPTPSPTTPEWKLLKISFMKHNSFLNGILFLDIVNGLFTTWRDTNTDGWPDTNCLDRNNNDLYDSGDSPYICSKAGVDPFLGTKLPAQAICVGAAFVGQELCPRDYSQPIMYKALGNVLVFDGKVTIGSQGAWHGTEIKLMITDMTAGTAEKWITYARHDGDEQNSGTTISAPITGEMVVVPGHTYRLRFQMLSMQQPGGSSNSNSRMSALGLNIYDYLSAP